MAKNKELASTFVFFEPGDLIDGDLELKLVQILQANESKNHVPQYKFHMFKTGTDNLMGIIGLRIVLNDHLKKYGGNMNYEVEEEFRGHRYASRSCKLLFPLAKKHGLSKLLITCSPDNIGSKKTCAAIGGKLVDTINVEIEPGRFRDTCRYEIPI
jgi:tagatose 1,6-diphosphate aldolase